MRKDRVAVHPFKIRQHRSLLAAACATVVCGRAVRIDTLSQREHLDSEVVAAASNFQLVIEKLQVDRSRMKWFGVFIAIAGTIGAA
jgi:hypothetical protein